MTEIVESENHISIKNLCYGNKKNSIKDMTTSFKRNKMTLIIDTNQVKSSILLKTICGKYGNKYKGDVLYNNIIVKWDDSLKCSTLVSKKIDLENFLFVEDILYFACRLRGKAMKTELLESLDIKNCMQEIAEGSINNIPADKKKRLALALVLLDDPKIIFIDELEYGIFFMDAVRILKDLKKLSNDLTIIITMRKITLEVLSIFDYVVHIDENDNINNITITDNIENIKSKLLFMHESEHSPETNIFIEPLIENNSLSNVINSNSLIENYEIGGEENNKIITGLFSNMLNQKDTFRNLIYLFIYKDLRYSIFYLASAVFRYIFIFGILGIVHFSLYFLDQKNQKTCFLLFFSVYCFLFSVTIPLQNLLDDMSPAVYKYNLGHFSFNVYFIYNLIYQIFYNIIGGICFLIYFILVRKNSYTSYEIDVLSAMIFFNSIIGVSLAFFIFSISSSVKIASFINYFLLAVLLVTDVFKYFSNIKNYLILLCLGGYTIMKLSFSLLIKNLNIQSYGYIFYFENYLLIKEISKEKITVFIICIFCLNFTLSYLFMHRKFRIESGSL